MANTIRIKDLTSGGYHDLPAETPVVVHYGHQNPDAVTGRTAQAVDRRLPGPAFMCTLADWLRDDPEKPGYVCDPGSEGQDTSHPGRFTWWASRVVTEEKT